MRIYVFLDLSLNYRNPETLYDQHILTNQLYAIIFLGI